MTDETPDAAPRALRRRLNADRIVAVCALLISIGTLYVLTQQTRLVGAQLALSQRQLAASVMPYLEIGDSSPSAGDYRLYVANRGIGPAFVDAVRIETADGSFTGDPAQYLFARSAAIGELDFFFASLHPGRLIPPGERVELLGTTDAPDAAARLRALFGETGARLVIDYRSVFDERWRTRSFGGAPQPLADPVGTPASNP